MSRELAENRRKRLEQLLRDKGSVRLDEAARDFKVSEMTIRRDLDLLQANGTALRVRGGAVAFEPAGFSVRAQPAAAAKVAIAAKLFELIPDQGAVAFDASSTVAVLAARAPDREGLTYYTNGVDTFLAMREHRRSELVLLGGKEDLRTGNLVGPLALKSLESLYFDLMISSCAGLNAQAGATEVTMEDAAVKRAVLEASERKVLAVDHAKIGTRKRAAFAELARFDLLVTDLDPSHPDLVDYRQLLEVR